MYIKFSPNEYVFRYKKGRVVAQGVGLSFFYFERNTSVCAIPTSTIDTDFIFEETTEDYQTVTVQGQVTYRIVDFSKIVNSIDFSVNMKTRKLNNDPLPKLSKRIVNLSQVLIKNKIGSITLTEAVNAGSDWAQSLISELQNNDELKELGIQVCGFSVTRVSSTNETSRALEAHTRETILKEADDALYERRNASIEQERRVKENELNTEISVEEKKKKIKETEIETKKMLIEKESELKKFEVEKRAERERIEIQAKTERERIEIESELELEKLRKELADLKLENAKKDADAEAYRISSVMEAYSKISPEVLVALSEMCMEPEKVIAQAFEKLAANSNKIGQLNITPDLLESVMNKRDEQV